MSIGRIYFFASEWDFSLLLFLLLLAMLIWLFLIAFIMCKGAQKAFINLRYQNWKMSEDLLWEREHHPSKRSETSLLQTPRWFCLMMLFFTFFVLQISLCKAHKIDCKEIQTIWFKCNCESDKSRPQPKILSRVPVLMPFLTQYTLI